MDPLLLLLTQAADDKEAQRHIDHLMREVISPHVTQIIQREMHVFLRKAAGPQSLNELTAQDLHGDILAQMVGVLQKAVRNRQSDIRNLRDYTFTVARNIITGDRRTRQDPAWIRLYTGVQRLLEELPNFDLWIEDAGDDAAKRAKILLCGLAGRHEEGRNPEQRAALIRLRENPAAHLPQDAAEMSLDLLLETIFREVGHPMRFWDLIDVVACLRGVTKQYKRTDPGQDGEREPLLNIQDSALPPEDRMALNDYLLRLWAALREMKPRSCAVCILDTGEHLSLLLMMCGIARLGEIAPAIGMTEAELRALWPKLPMRDAQIGELLGMTTQQVTEMRRATRDKLARRMKE